jgi:hypothetical protein
MPTSSGGPARSRGSSSPVRVLSVPVGIPVTVLFLSGYRGMDSHRVGKGTEPCPGPSECGHCKRRQGIIWKGYAPVLAWDQVRELWHPFVIELTESIEEELRGRQLRGEVWSLWREGKGKNNDPVTGLFLERKQGSVVIEPFDIVSVLLRMYHVSSIRLDRPNTMPGKLVLPAIAGDAPKLPEDVAKMIEPQKEEEQKQRFASMRREYDERGRRSAGRSDQADDQAGKHETNGTNHDKR